MADTSDRRRAGFAKQTEVYGPNPHLPTDLDGLPPESSPLITETIEHLFGDIWSRPGLSVRDRRLLVIGVIAGLGRQDLAEIQFRGALLNDELTPEQIGEAVLHLAYYTGWPNSTALQRGAMAAVASMTEDAG